MYKIQVDEVNLKGIKKSLFNANFLLFRLHFEVYFVMTAFYGLLIIMDFK